MADPGSNVESTRPCACSATTSSKLADFEIRPARPGEAAPLAELMLREIHWGRLNELGTPFVTLIHQHMIASSSALTRVACRGDEIVGYVVLCLDTARFYRSFLLRRGVEAGLLLVRRLLRREQREVIRRGLTYFPDAHTNDPSAEILSVAVDARAASAGVGRRLMESVLGEAHALGVDSVKIGTVSEQNHVGRRFYESLGGEVLRRESFYEDSHVLVYVIGLEGAPSS